MQFKSKFSRFQCDESGAITADWVVLVAGACGLAMFVVLAVSQGTTTASTRIDDRLDGMKTEIFEES